MRSSPADICAERSTIVATGPVEYVILEFPGNKFTGEIAPELAKLTESGTVRLIDLIFISKDADGTVDGFRADEHLERLAPFSQLEEIERVMSQEDIEFLVENLAPNSSAVLFVWENTWAIPLVEALRNSGAVFREGARFSAI